MSSALPFSLDSIPESHRRALLRELRTGEMMERVQAEARQKVIAKDNQRDHRAIPGVGRLVARFDAEGYLKNYIKNKECARDTDYIKWAIKRHPECRVNSVGTKLQVGYGSKQFETDAKPSVRRVKYHKSYS
jgi:hypothetical protein|tara:strand:+ start:97 stop:492 length:396 start_codon:yes stop_codon:yes gene_type:complete